MYGSRKSTGAGEIWRAVMGRRRVVNAARLRILSSTVLVGLSTIYRIELMLTLRLCAWKSKLLSLYAMIVLDRRNEAMIRS